MSDQIPKGWRKVKLGEVIKIIRGVSYSSNDLKKTSGDVLFVNLKNIERGGGFRNIGLKFYSGDYSVNQLVKKGDIIIATTDLTPTAEIIGMPALVPQINKFACISMDLVKLDVDEKQINKVFLYFLLKTKKYKGWIKGFINGVNVLHLKIDGINKFETLIPIDLNEQQRIASILSAFDEKIEVNNKINEKLENLGREIFKQLFNKQNLETWEKGYLGDKKCSEIITPRINKFDGEKIYLATADVNGTKIINKKTKITYFNRPIRANCQPILNSIWFAKMVNTYKVLFFSENNKDEINKYILSTGFMGIKCLNNMHYYLYFFINSKEFHKLKDSLVQGAVQEAITNSNIRKIDILIPPQSLIKKFNSQIELLIKKIFLNELENEKLAKLRDLLLSKLMKGEIRI